MRRERLFVLAAVLFTIPAGRAYEKNEEKKLDPELKKLQGTWELTYHETAGKEDTKDHQWKLEVKGDAYTLTEGASTTKGTIRLDPSKKPRHLDYTVGRGDDAEEFTGVYELDGDTYKSCDVAKGQARPTEFKTKEETGQVAVWKRVKPKD